MSRNEWELTERCASEGEIKLPVSRPRYEDAEAAASAALALDPSHAKARLRRGRARLELGELMEARSDAEAAAGDAGAGRPAKAAAAALLKAVAVREGAADAVVLRVPGDFPTISAAIAVAEAADRGCVVAVAAGDFPERLSLRGCAGGALRVVGAGAPAATTVEALDISGNDVTAEALDVSAGATVGPGATRATLFKCVVANAAGPAVETAGTDVLLEACVLEHAVDGLVVSGGAATARATTIQRCDVDGVRAAVAVVLEDVTVENCGRRGLTGAGVLTCAAPASSRVTTTTTTAPLPSHRPRRAAPPTPERPARRAATATPTRRPLTLATRTSLLPQCGFRLKFSGCR